MTDIQRYSLTFAADGRVEHMGRDARGRYVTHADHVAAVAKAVAEAQAEMVLGLEWWNQRVNDAQEQGYEQGQRDERAAAVERVEALAVEVSTEQGTERWISAEESEVIAAINGGTDET
jgi:hypothetical protein